MSVSNEDDRDQLILRLPGNEALIAYAPDDAPSENFPDSFRKVLSRHAFLQLYHARIGLGDHGLFCESDGWWTR